MNSGFVTYLAQEFNVTAPILLVLALGVFPCQKKWVAGMASGVKTRASYS
jgi:hypothetical protein